MQLNGTAFLYFLNFSIQLFIMEGIYARLLSRKKNFGLRFVLGMAGYVAVGGILSQINRQLRNTSYLFSMLFFILLFGLSLLLLHILFEGGWREILFVGTAGYASQHIGYSIEDLLWRSMQQKITYTSVILLLDELVLQFLFFLVVGMLLYRFLVRKQNGIFEIKETDLKMTVLSFCVLFVSSVLSVSGENRAPEFGNRLIFHLYGAISCSLGLALQFDISNRNRLETENSLLEQMIQSERRQQAMTKESIDIINMKCHDLKHQVQALEKIDNRGMRQKAIQEINDQVMIYDSVTALGNDALDLVITEKSLYCSKYNIKFSYLADGSLLEFMDSADIFSLFGNAIDNAIECVIQEEEEKRIISLQIQKRGQMCLVRMENYCSQKLDFREGLPVTTKGDKNVHGFGTRSIRYIVNRYEGEVNMYLENGKYHLDMMFPLQNN